ncbi:MAG: porin [Spiribacter salinus]|uniref:Porin n=1 Tax=Spiribacter salinus TaxID=1335746 RepID=A0A540VQP8_9GAMM|nr:MAG: porin [Spiribacter salinus]
MRKLLLGSAAVALGLSLAAPAQAQDGVNLDVGGHLKGYVTWSDSDTNVDLDNLDNDGDITTGTDDDRDFDILRETEIHFTGETTLDNGLTVGVHVETDLDNNVAVGPADEDMQVEESYAYFSGAWGRFNMGKEDGAAYLLQVSAPSADSNIDGLRQYVQPINYMAGDITVGEDAAGATAFGLFNQGNFTGTQFDVDNDGAAANNLVVSANNEFDPNTNVVNPMNTTGLTSVISDVTRFDYDQAQAGFDNKLTYMTPVFNGFQAGVSYTPDVDEGTRGLNGTGQNDLATNFGEAWEISARYEGQFEGLGIAFGGAYSEVDLEEEIGDTNADGNEDGVVAFTDVNGNGTLDFGTDTDLIRMADKEAWNVGLDLDWQAFGLGGAYIEEEAGFGGAFEADTWTIGLDYTTGPFKLGANYYNQDRDFFDVAEIETERWSGGVVYTYGPGMTFRGSLNYTDVEAPTFGSAANEDNTQDQDTTSVLLGTQINF